MKKYLVFGIVILFVGVSVFPSISGIIRNRDLLQSDVGLRNIYFADDRDEFDMDGCDYINPLPDIKPTIWWNYWKDFPERYEPFFDVNEFITVGDYSHGMTTADFNDDDLLDFAVSYRNYTYYSNISIFYNNGDDTFTEEILIKIKDFDISLPSGVPLNIDDLNAADYDRDGDIDLLFTYNERWWKGGLLYNWNGTGIILINNGANNFDNWRTVFWHKPFGNSSFEKRINPHITSNDFDNDGNIDFLVGDNSGSVTFYKNDGTGNFTKVCVSDFGTGVSGISWGIASADFDNDDDIDFIATQVEMGWNGHIYLSWNDGTPSCFNHSDQIPISFLPPYETIFTVGPSDTGCLSPIDYDDDGTMDFLFGGRGNIWLFKQKGHGIFEPHSICRFPQSADPDGGGWFLDDTLREGGMAVGDLNGDGLDDVVTSGSSGIVRLFYNNYVLVDIVHPDRSCIILSNEIKVWQILIYRSMKHGISLVLGDLTVVASPLAELSKVEFYLDGKLKFTDESEPYEWKWNKLSFGRHKIKAVAYNMDGEQSGFDDAIVWKFL